MCSNPDCCSVEFTQWTYLSSSYLTEDQGTLTLPGKHWLSLPSPFTPPLELSQQNRLVLHISDYVQETVLFWSILLLNLAFLRFLAVAAFWCSSGAPCFVRVDSIGSQLLHTCCHGCSVGSGSGLSEHSGSDLFGNIPAVLQFWWGCGLGWDYWLPRCCSLLLLLCSTPRPAATERWRGLFQLILPRHSPSRRDPGLGL